MTTLVLSIDLDGAWARLSPDLDPDLDPELPGPLDPTAIERRLAFLGSHVARLIEADHTTGRILAPTGSTVGRWTLAHPDPDELLDSARAALSAYVLADDEATRRQEVGEAWEAAAEAAAVALREVLAALVADLNN